MGKVEVGEMLKMKRKGFTLIELLAVIVILAIIAIIATPMIMDVIEKSRKGAALSTANNYLHQVELYKGIQDLDPSVKLKNNKVYTLYEDSELYEGTDTVSEIYLSNIIEVKGEYPEDGYIKIGNGKVIEASFNVNGYIIECDEQSICEVVDHISSNPIKAESITIKEIDTSGLSVGDTVQLEATILPENTTRKKVVWTSSNEEVATVSDTGLLTVVGFGTTTITAKTSNNKENTTNVIVAASIFNGEKVNYATFSITRDSPAHVIEIKDGAIRMETPNTWDEGGVHFSDLTIDSTKYKKLVIDIEWKQGYGAAIRLKDINDNIIQELSYTNAFSRQNVEIDLTNKSKINKLSIISSSYRSQMVIYGIHFE